MATPSEKGQGQLSNEERTNLRGELWIIIPFFIFAVYLFLGSFRYKVEASTVPMVIGLGTAILAGMRLFYIFFPQFRIGEFKEGGLAGEFDQMKDEIEEEAMKGRTVAEPEKKEVTFADEKKAFITLIGCFLAFLLFGYIVGMFFVVVGSSYYYGYKDKVPLLISLAALYLVVYVVLYKLLDAPADFGILLEPILKSFDLV